MKDIYLDIKMLNKNGYAYLKEIFNFPDSFKEDPESLFSHLDAMNNLYIHIENAYDATEESLSMIEVIMEVAEFDPSILVV